MQRFYFLVILALISLSCSCTGNSENKENKKNSLFIPGAGKVLYRCENPFQGKEIDIYYFIPDGNIETMPVLIVMHGVGRNADGYRDSWISYAKEYGFIVLVPHFTKEIFPEIDYQQGAILTADGKVNSKEKVTYNLVGDIFEYFLQKSDSKAKKCNIYGHSAGSQFVHRFMLYCDTPYIDKAIAANAGWYTFPTDTIEFPYGAGESMQKMNLDRAKYYSKNMVILLGDADTIRTSSLRQTKEADLQGLNRFERGHTFFNYCKNDAQINNLDFNWTMQYVKDAHHSNILMVPTAAEILYGNKL